MDGCPRLDGLHGRRFLRLAIHRRNLLKEASANPEGHLFAARKGAPRRSRLCPAIQSELFNKRYINATKRINFRFKSGPSAPASEAVIDLPPS